jgi:hypothetical protein
MKFTLFNKKTVSKGLNVYLKIQNMLGSVNVSTDPSFQKLFNGYYKLRQLPSDFYKYYYDLMEKGKKRTPSFKEVLEDLYFKTGKIYCSYASKLVHTLDNNSPILDKYVLRWMGYSIQPTHSKKQKNAAISYYEDAYENIKAEYGKIQKKKYMKSGFSEFDRLYLNFKDISNVKKIDCFIMSHAGEILHSLFK